MRNFIAINIFLFVHFNLVLANEDCQKLRLIESSIIKTKYFNTSHDFFGRHDEIEMAMSLSSTLIDEKKMFSDYWGIIGLHPGQTTNILPAVKKKVRFNSETEVSQIVVNHSLLYNKFLNIVMVDRDIKVPMASGSLEMPFVILSGGNHDDLIFSRSLAMDFSLRPDIKFVSQNQKQDKLEVVVYPHSFIDIERSVLIEEYQRINVEISNKMDMLKNSKISYISGAKIEKEKRDLEAKLAYYKDLLDGKLKYSCIN